jgi:hypothetical protein
MGQRFTGLVVAMSGVTLVVVSVLADTLPVGGEDYTFGWLQKTGVLVGCSLVAALVVRARELHRSLPGVPRVQRVVAWRLPGLRPPAA